MRLAFLKTILLFNIFFVSSLAHAVDYEERLLQLEILGQSFPGRFDDRTHEYQKYGMWAGIYFQTDWQHSAPFGPLRSEINLWEKVNRTLTVVPSKISQLFLENRDVDCSDRFDIALPADLNQRQEVCELWVSYFRESLFPINEEALQSLLWRAHEGAISIALDEHREEFLSADVPDIEYWFWKGWTRNVSYVAERNLPTNTDFSKYYGRLPLCVLGTKGCLLDNLTPVERSYSCLMVRLALEENPRWRQKVIDYIALNVPQDILEPFLALPIHCRKAKKLMESAIERF